MVIARHSRRQMRYIAIAAALFCIVYIPRQWSRSSVSVTQHVITQHETKDSPAFEPKHKFEQKESSPQVDPEAIRKYLSQYRKGEPTEMLIDNLKDEQDYIVTFTDAKRPISLLNTIYLGSLLKRAVVLPLHIVPLEDGSGIYLRMSDVYNLDHLRNKIGLPILDWTDMKLGLDPEQLKCLAASHSAIDTPVTAMRDENEPEGVTITRRFESWLGLHVSYSRMTSESLSIENIVEMNAMVSKTKQQQMEDSQDQQQPMGSEGPRTGQLLCFNSLDTVPLNSTAIADRWQYAGKHLVWSDDIKTAAKKLFKEVFYLPAYKEVPPFIAVHIAKKHLGGFCEDPDAVCRTYIDVFKEKVESVKRQLLEEKGIKASRVMVVSDERDYSWWQQIYFEGWGFIGDAHRDISPEGAETDWPLPFVEDAVLSMASGFVGTEGSTTSYLASLRVKEWNKGIVRTVKEADEYARIDRVGKRPTDASNISPDGERLTVDQILGPIYGRSH